MNVNEECDPKRRLSGAGSRPSGDFLIQERPRVPRAWFALCAPPPWGALAAHPKNVNVNWPGFFGLMAYEGNVGVATLTGYWFEELRERIW